MHKFLLRLLFVLLKIYAVLLENINIFLERLEKIYLMTFLFFNAIIKLLQHTKTSNKNLQQNKFVICTCMFLETKM